jgi:hypothetical protein
MLFRFRHSAAIAAFGLPMFPTAEGQVPGMPARYQSIFAVKAKDISIWLIFAG